MVSEVLGKAYEKDDVNVKILFVGLYNTIPKEFYSWQKTLDSINTFRTTILEDSNWYVINRVEHRNSKFEYIEDYITYGYKGMNIILELALDIHIKNGRVNLYYDNDSFEVNTWIESIKNLTDYVEQKKENNIKIICNNYGYYLNDCSINPIELDIKANYNDDFEKINDKIIEDLKKLKSSLFLFHGSPGTGKSSYIRYLINSVDKQVIYLPPTMVTALADAKLVSFLQEDCKNSIIIVEDAEDALLSRDAVSHNAAVNNILNFSDGIMSGLNLQFICTFNCDESKIDSALKRKGRLTQMYKFEPLKKEKAQLLSNSLGYDVEVKNDMSLADIYNQEDNGVIKKKRIGFA